MKLGQEMIDTRWQDHGELQLTLPKKKKKGNWTTRHYQLIHHVIL